MYKEYRDITLNGAVEQMYTEMASRHRVRFPCIQIIKTATSPRSFASEKVPNSSIIPKSSSYWCSRRVNPQRGSSRQHIRHPSPTCLCNLVGQFAE